MLSHLTFIVFVTNVTLFQTDIDLSRILSMPMAVEISEYFRSLLLFASLHLDLTNFKGTIGGPNCSVPHIQRAPGAPIYLAETNYLSRCQ